MPPIGETLQGGADAPAARHRRCRGAHEDPCEVPARARERGVGAAARARPSSRPSCVPTPRWWGSTRTCSWRSTGISTRREETQDFQPLAPRRAPRRPTAAGAPPPAAAAPPAVGGWRGRRRWSASCWCSACSVVTTTARRATRTEAAHAPSAPRPRPRASAAAEAERQPAPTAGNVRVAPDEPTYAVWTRATAPTGRVREHARRAAHVPQRGAGADQPRPSGRPRSRLNGEDRWRSRRVASPIGLRADARPARARSPPGPRPCA